MSTLTRNLIQRDRNRNARRRGTMRNRSASHRRPLLEILEDRVLLTVSFDYNPTTSTVTFGGDGSPHTLLLSENSGNLSYKIDTLDTVVTSVPIGGGTPPAITVALGDTDNTLILDSSWSFTDRVDFRGGAGHDVLDDRSVQGGSLQFTGADSGNNNNNGSSNFSFSSVDAIVTSGVTYDLTTNTFTGDGLAPHTLLLSESSAFLSYTADPDGPSGATPVVTPVAIGGTTPPSIAVDLGATDNTLRLDSSWSFADPVTFT